eukprot:jgi/Ulvmu1/7963/UM004_0196.1
MLSTSPTFAWTQAYQDQRTRIYRLVPRACPRQRRALVISNRTVPKPLDVMASKHITLFFDVQSPFSYLAFEMLERCKNDWDIAVTYKPVHIGALFRATGNGPPARSVPEKGTYAFRDLRRRAALIGIPYHGPPSNSLAHGDAKDPFKSTPGLRLLVAALEQHGSGDRRCTQLIRRMFHSVMYDHKGTSIQLTPALLLSNARDSGFSEAEAEQLLQASTGQACRAGLQSATAEAIAEKAFGVPFMLLEGDGVAPRDRHWFGADSLYTLGLFLGKPMAPFTTKLDASSYDVAVQRSKL